MRYKKIHYQWSMAEETFVIVIHRFSLVKAAMNAPCVCELRKNCLTGIDQCPAVLKTPQFLHFPINIFQVCNKFSSPLSKWVA
jgi:hypothetical protein